MIDSAIAQRTESHVQPDIAEKREALADLCHRYGVERLEVFGSAARSDFDRTRSGASARPMRSHQTALINVVHHPPT
jgi:hypothetical protein